VGTAKRERKKANRQLRLEELEREQKRAKTRKRTIQVVLGLAVFVLLAWLLSVAVSGRGDGGSATDTTTTVATETTVAGDTTVAPAETTVPGTETTLDLAGGRQITGETPCPKTDGTEERATLFENPPPLCIDVDKTYTATFTTNLGEFTVALDAKRAPETVNNFVVLARYGFYDTVTCHRIIKDFVVQCGDPAGTGAGAFPGYTIPDELPEAGEYEEGSLAMANRSAPDTGGGQFFIITGPNGAALPPAYSLFGQVTEGYDPTVQAMEDAADPAAPNGTPTLEPVIIEKVTITES
jgi:cyclophilin family peptidyl-prolyl cis-trans isomerase